MKIKITKNKFNVTVIQIEKLKNKFD